MMRSNVKLTIPDLPSTDNPELFNALLTVYSSIRSLSSYITNNLGGGVPTGDATDGILTNSTVKAQELATVYAIATEAMVPGTLVYFTASGGKLAVTPATASGAGAYEAQGIVGPGLAVIPNQLCKVYLFGIAQLQYTTTPFSPGQFLYLAAIPGGKIETNPANIASANIKQRVGLALDAYTDMDNNQWQNIWFNPNYGLNVI